MIESLAILYCQANDLNFGIAQIILELYILPFQIALNYNFSEIFNFITKVEILHIRSEVHIFNSVVEIGLFL